MLPPLYMLTADVGCCFDLSSRILLWLYAIIHVYRVLYASCEMHCDIPPNVHIHTYDMMTWEDTIQCRPIAGPAVLR